MNFSFLTSLFNKKTQPLLLPNSLLIKQLKAIAEKNNYTLFTNAIIYHHTKAYDVGLIIFDESRGLYIFEKKDWSYDDLKNATIEKAENQKSTKETLSYQKTQSIINQKFNEITHRDCVPIFNYLLMENLNADEYKHLNSSFKELLPKNRVIFSDSSAETIIEKLHHSPKSIKTLPNKNAVIGNLLIQYTILDEQNKPHLCTRQQIEFINSHIEGLQILQAIKHSGKSESLLLKAIVEKLKNRKKQIIILKPTTLACDIIKKKLLNIIEHAIVELDLTSIMVLTPLELLNMHLTKLHKNHVQDIIYIDTILMQKKFSVADFIMCDDANIYNDNFIHYLQHIQQNAALLLVNSSFKESRFNFTESFTSKEKRVNFYDSNQYATTMHLLLKLLQNNDASDILIVSQEQTRINLKEDLEFFIESETVLLDSSQNLLNQELDNLLLATYADTNALSYKHIILLDIVISDIDEIISAIEIASQSATLIYEQDNDIITKLKEEYEN